MEKIRCWIVGPYQLYNQALISFFDRFPGFIGIGQTTELVSWDRFSNDLSPNVVLFNLLSITEIEKNLRVDFPYIFVSIHHDWTVENIKKALELGIVGCVDSRSPEDEFLSIIQQNVKGESALSSQLAINLYLNMAKEEKDKERIEFEELTPREREVLELLCRGLSSKQIAQRLYLSVRTIDNHLANMYSKMNVNSRTEAAVLALKNGWVETEY